MNIKVSLMHVCYDDPECITLWNEVTSLAELQYLIQFTSHFGTHIECQYNLMTFGIPLEILPITTEEIVHFDDHKQFLKRLQEGAFRNSGSGSGSCGSGSRNSTGITDAAFVAINLDSQLIRDKSSSLTTTPTPLHVVLGRGRRGVKLPENVILK